MKSYVRQKITILGKYLPGMNFPVFYTNYLKPNTLAGNFLPENLFLLFIL
jgi:hypothetical protein